MPPAPPYEPVARRLTPRQWAAVERTFNRIVDCTGERLLLQCEWEWAPLDPIGDRAGLDPADSRVALRVLIRNGLAESR